MHMMAAVSEPHCNGTVAYRNDATCLLLESSINELTKKSPGVYDVGNPVWYGLGFAIRDYGTDENWWHAGSLPGTETLNDGPHERRVRLRADRVGEQTMIRGKLRCAHVGDGEVREPLAQRFRNKVRRRKSIIGRHRESVGKPVKKSIGESIKN